MSNKICYLLLLVILCSCQRNYIPKPHAYFRIDFPEREYRLFDDHRSFAFEYPIYGTMVPDTRKDAEPGWYDLKFPRYRGTIHLTYLEIDDNFDDFIEDNWRFLFRGIAQRADAIEEEKRHYHDTNVFGTVYDVKGDAASHVVFLATDSVKNFIRGSLYFTVRPNHDSLAPVVAFFREDIIHLIESIRWKEVK